MSLIPLSRYGTLQTGQVEPDFSNFETHKPKTIKKKKILALIILTK